MPVFTRSLGLLSAIRTLAMVMLKERLAQFIRSIGLLSANDTTRKWTMAMRKERPAHRAQHLLDQMAGEIESDERKSALGRQLADAIAAGRGVEADAIHTAMHWAPAVVVGNITEAELVRTLDGVVSHELMATAATGYREILCNVAQRWAGAIAKGYVTELTVIEELGMPADIVSAAVAKYKRVCAEKALTEAADNAEQLAETLRSVVNRKLG